jgi:hypothetical protein
MNISLIITIVTVIGVVLYAIRISKRTKTH